jgi:hypothetical protein
MNISRRFFLGGAISLVAAATFTPTVSAMMNLPTIYGDGVQDDTSGLYALLNNEPCTFNKEQIGVESHEGIVFHNGRFLIRNTIEIPGTIKLKVEAPTFIGTELEDNQMFFLLGRGFDMSQFEKWAVFEVNKTHKSRFMDFKSEKYGDYDDR